MAERERDPKNLLLARQNRFRLDAEIIRDAALSASGLLSRKIGGPSVFPPQPDGTIPLYSPYAWTVPGAVDGWFEPEGRVEALDALSRGVQPW